MKERIERLCEASDVFQECHIFKEGMPVRLKKGFGPEDGNISVFMYMLPNPFGGNNDSPLHYDNFMIADCVIMVVSDGYPMPALADSRFLEPFIEEDERQLQLEL